MLTSPSRVNILNVSDLVISETETDEIVTFLELMIWNTEAVNDDDVDDELAVVNVTLLIVMDSMMTFSAAIICMKL